MGAAVMAKEPNTQQPAAPSTPLKIPRIDLSRPMLPIVWAAIAVGILLIAFVIAGRSYFGIPSLFANLLIASGTAIILAAFGGQAIVSFSGYALAGVAAIAVVLFGSLCWQDSTMATSNNEKLKLLKNSYLRGQIKGLPDRLYKVHLALVEYVPSSHLHDLKRFDFVMFKGDLDRSGAASLEIEETNNPDNIINLKIPQECLSNFLGLEKPVLLEFDATKGALIEESAVDGARNIISSVSDDVKTVPCQGQHASLEEPKKWASGLQWISSALAQEAYPKISRSEIDQALTDVESADSDIRRGARNLLSRVEPEDVGYVLMKTRERLALNKNQYRMKLGVSIALTELLRRDKNLRDRMKFEPEDLNLLLEFASSDERNLRIYSGEFLYDLENPDVAKLALNLAQTTQDDDARYNLIFISQGGWLKFTPEIKNAYSSNIDQLKSTSTSLPKTTDLLKNFEYTNVK
jgi:hypothetical protein